MFTEIMITGTFHDATGKALNGTVEATLSSTMQNNNVSVLPKVIKAKIANGALSMKVLANTDPETNPKSIVYTFKITLAGGPKETFIVQVPNSPTTIDIAELRNRAGAIGPLPVGKPRLNANASSPQEIIEALGFLELVTVIHNAPEPGVIV